MTEEDLTVNTLGIRMSPTNTAPLIFYHQHSTIRIRRIQAPGSGRHDKFVEVQYIGNSLQINSQPPQGWKFAD
jgi:hypothetical protein